MSLFPAAVFRPWRRPGAHICRRCAQTLFQQPGRPRQRQQQQQQQRHVAGKAFAKYGPKYQAKIDSAGDEWKERAELIKAGQAKAMWDILEERGYVKDVAGTREGVRELLTQKRIGAYVGIDPTAPSLHVGHLLPLMPLFWMYMHGFRAVSLIGGATAKIGDPSGRLTSRDAMAGSTVAMNMVKIHYQLKKIWLNVDEQARRYGYRKTWAWRRGVLQNGHWWNKLPMLEVLQRLGKGLRIGPMLSRDTVKRKMQQGDGVSFAEFSYPLMQAWDWWHMYRSQGVQMQIGGSDQYGNIVTGVDAFKIIRASEPDPAARLPEGALHDPVGFTVPLLTDSSGAKFGKSAGNAVWLDKFQTPTFALYGYFMRRPDADLPTLLRLFTFLPLDRVDALLAEHEADPSQRPAHHALAYEVVLLVHGKAEADAAQAQHRAAYSKKGGATPAAGEEEEDVAVVETPAADEATTASTGLPATANTAPRVDMQLPRSLFEAGRVARILYAAGMVNSVSEGNRLAVQKGAYVGAAPGQNAARNKGMLLTQVEYTPVHLWFPRDTKNFIIDDKYMVLRKGRHNVRVIEIVSDEAWKASGRTYPGEPYTGKTRYLRDQLQALKTAAATGSSGAGAGSSRGAAVRAAITSKAPADGRLVFPDAKSSQVRRLEAELRQELARQEKAEKEEEQKTEKEEKEETEKK